MSPRVTLLMLAAAVPLLLGAAPSETPIANADELAGDCGEGSTISCIHLGVLHRHGIGAQKNSRRALTYFLEACEKGYALACGMVGDMTYRGEGVRANVAQGETLMRAACVRRNEWSCESLRLHGILRRGRTQS